MFNVQCSMFNVQSLRFKVQSRYFGIKFKVEFKIKNSKLGIKSNSELKTQMSNILSPSRSIGTILLKYHLSNKIYHLKTLETKNIKKVSIV
jgi:hypothetical protein